jgi:hypothetical protein
VPTRREVEELARRLWEAFRGRRVTLDRLGRPSYIVTFNLARRLLEIAEGAGVADPLYTVDWVAVLDPDLEPGENIRLFSRWVVESLGRRIEVSEEVDAYVSELERYLSYLRGELERAPPEERPGIEAEIKAVEAEIESLRRARRPAERRARPPVKPPPKPPPPPPPRYPRARELPLAEARFRIERYIRERVARAYRFDWRDLRARISYHRDVEGDLRRVVGELEGRVERVVEARPPLKVMDVDFSDAVVPAVYIPAEFERLILWSKFSSILRARGVDPRAYEDDFNALFEALRDRPLEEKQRRIEELAEEVAPPPPRVPPPPVIPRELVERLERMERIVRTVEERVRAVEEATAWRPKSPEDLRMIYEAFVFEEPEIVLRFDEYGHPYYGPSDKTLSTMRMGLDERLIHYFLYCPADRFRLPGGAMRPSEYIEDAIRFGLAVPIFAEWLRRVARRIEEHERGVAVE